MFNAKSPHVGRHIQDYSPRAHVVMRLPLRTSHEDLVAGRNCDDATTILLEIQIVNSAGCCRGRSLGGKVILDFEGAYATRVLELRAKRPARLW